MTEPVLDMDSSVSETYGQQEGTAYNGHFECTCYHPLFCCLGENTLAKRTERSDRDDSTTEVSR